MTTSEQLYEISDVISDAALATLRKARADYSAGRINAEEFGVINSEYAQSMSLATRITGIGIHAAASHLPELTARVEQSTKAIKQAIARIEHASNALKIIGSILAFAASIVAAAARSAGYLMEPLRSVTMPAKRPQPANGP